MKYFLFLFFPSLCFTQVSLDTSFGVDGKAVFYNCPINVLILNLDYQSDNKIIHGYGGYNSTYGVFSRINSNGTLDTTFGDNGYYELSTNTTSVLQPESNYTMVEFEVQNDNKIVSAGRRESLAASTFCISRLNSNGGLDTTFNSTGFLEVSFGAGVSRGNCMKLQNDGKILVGGRSGSSSQYFSILRLNSDGTFDTSFGTLGKVQTLMIGQSLPYSIALQSDGKILMGGYVLNNPNGYDFALVRYLSNGTLDTDFGTNGIVITAISTLFSDSIRKVLVQLDGKIVVVGNYADSSGESRVTIVRYMSNGTIDTSFATNGIYISEYYGGSYDAEMQIDGKIVVSAETYVSDLGYNKFNVIRINANGLIDSDFNVSNVNFPISENSGASSIVILPDNKILVGGQKAPDSICNTSPGILVRINPGTLSTNEFEDNNFVVYPNPTINFISFDNSIAQFQKATLFNYLGQEVAFQSLNSSSEEQIDISSFLSGVYLLKLENNLSQKTIKIIKKN